MLELLGESGTLVVIGFLGGMALGIAARLGRFCTLGAIEDFHFGGSSIRLRMWAMAIGTGILCVAIAGSFGWVDPAQSVYVTQPQSYATAAFGGLVFGIGMALAGNCGYGALARLGGGELRSFVILLVMGLAAMATISGPLGPLRVALSEATSVDAPQSMSTAAAIVFGIPALVVPFLLAAAFLCLSLCGELSPRVLWGVPVGLAIASGLIGTHWVANVGFEAVPVFSHSFAAPIGDSMLYLMLSTGLTPGFGLGSVAGVLSGAFVASKIKGAFRWEACDDSRELRRQITGAVMMGIGAVMAFGCSVGQGLSAFAALSVTAPITLAAIWLGGVIGLKFLIEGGVFGRVQKH